MVKKGEIMILFYSGTGNSEHIARRMADNLGDEVISINKRIKEGDISHLGADTLIFSFPTYAWKMPRIVEEWIKDTSFKSGAKAYFIMNCGDDVGAAEKYIKKLCAQKGIVFMGFAKVIMPENYIVMFNCPAEEKIRKVIAAADIHVDELTEYIKAGKEFPGTVTRFIGKILTGLVNPFFYRFVIKAKPFTVDEKCISCGLCEKECMLNNIELIDGKPVWGDVCTHCMACICKCPTGAIEYGKKTAGKNRYVCPK